MPTEVIMPKVDMDMTHGTFATWHVAEGAEVRQGAPLFDIETEKAAMEVEAPASGRLFHISVKPGDRIEVGTTIAWLYAPGEELVEAPGGVVQTPAAASAPEVAAAPPPQPEKPVPPAMLDASASDRVRATPAARSAARAAGIALTGIWGSGPHGRIQRDDVAGLERAQILPAAMPVSSGWSTESGPLSVTRRDGAGPPLLLLHGFTADSKSWAPLEKALGAGRPLIRIDLPGHGRSPKRQIDSFASLARMLVDAFDHAVPDGGTVHVVGHSLGAALALAIADVRPRLIQSLTLISPAGLGPQIDADTLLGITRASHASSLAPWLRNLVADPSTISDDYARAAFQLRTDAALRAAQADMAQALFRDGTQTFDLRPALSRLQLPAQIIWGRQDRVIAMQQILSVRGEFGLHLIEGAGHIPHYELPERIARIAMRFVSGVEAST